MVDYSGIPKPFALTDAMRAEEEERRRREVTGSARNTEETTIGAGGMLTLDGGGLDVVNGGLGRIRDGGVWNVEGGGSMDITGDGQINAVGEGRHRFTREIVKVTASLANRMMTNLWESVTYLQAGLYFNTGGESRGALDPRVVSEDGKSVAAISSAEKMMYGPQVGPNIMAKSTYKAGPEHASIGAYAWDDSVNPGGGDGDTGRRGAGTVAVTPYDLSILLSNYTDGPDGIPSGPAFWINGTLEEGKLNIYTRNGLDVQGTFTVNGQPVGGGTWDSITGKPTTFPPSAHGHNNATTTTPGFMSPTDKGKLDGATASPSANTVMYRDAWGRAQIADPVGGDDVANKRAVDAGVAKLTGSTTRNSPPLLIYRRNALLTLTSGWLGNVPWDAVDEDATLNPGDPGRMYAPIAGVYQFSCFITLNDPNKTGNRQVVVKKGSGTGSSVNYTGVASNPVASANFAGSFTTPIRMAAGDYLEVVAYQNSGANATFYASSSGQSYNNASMQWLRP